MTTTPTAGWYPDPAVPGVLRWFDGVQWTSHLQAAPPPAYAPPGHPSGPGQQAPVGPWHQPGGWPATEQERMGSDPSDPMHWILPTGRSWQSITAGYLGLLALVVWPLGPVAVGLGAWALRRAQDGGHGRGRAIFGIVAGLAGTVFGVLYLLSL